MQIEYVRQARASLLWFLGIIAIPLSASGEEAEALAFSASPSLADLSSNLSLAMPLTVPGFLEGQAAPEPAPVPVPGPIPPSRQGHADVKAGMGFTLSPTDFLLTLQADYFLTHNFSVGPLLQFGVDDDPFIFAPTLNFQGMFDLPGPDLERLKPFVQGGLGIAYMDEVRRNQPDRDDVGFMFNIGGGIEYFLTDRFSIGNNIMFNIMPVDVLGDHFFFSWQFVTVRYQF